MKLITIAIALFLIAPCLRPQCPPPCPSVPAPLSSTMSSPVGVRVHPLPDLNGDGISDYAIAETGFTGAGFASPNGRVTIVDGRTDSALTGFQGVASGDRIGWQILAYDRTGDGLLDLIVSGLGGTGVIQAFNQVPGATPSFVSAARQTGYSVGDRYGHALELVNCGPFVYVLVGAPQNASAAGYVDFVSPTSFARPFGPLIGPAAGDEFGYSLGILGDWNGNGLLEFLVGCPQGLRATPSKGYVQSFEFPAGSCAPPVALGPNAAAGTSNFDLFGHCITMHPDLDGDGLADALIGAPFTLPTTAQGGFVRILYSSGATSANFFFPAVLAAGAQLGWSIELCGDLSPCGSQIIPDVLFSAPGADTVLLVDGLSLVLGGTPSLLGTWTRITGSRHGESMAAIDDRGRGATGFAVTAPLNAGGLGGVWTTRTLAALTLGAAGTGQEAILSLNGSTGGAPGWVNAGGCPFTVTLARPTGGSLFTPWLLFASLGSPAGATFTVPGLSAPMVIDPAPGGAVLPLASGYDIPAGPGALNFAFPAVPGVVATIQAVVFDPMPIVSNAIIGSL